MPAVVNRVFWVANAGDDVKAQRQEKDGWMLRGF
jgi:hypothetical protein